MTEYIQIDGNINLVRDKNSRAIINKNRGDLEKYKANRQKRLAQEEKINKLEKDVSDIKHLLAKILEKID